MLQSDITMKYCSGILVPNGFLKMTAEAQRREQ
jgi:hypothetical protein